VICCCNFVIDNGIEYILVIPIYNKLQKGGKTMTKSKSLKALAIIFFLSGVWDIMGGINYAFLIGTVYPVPPIHRFYAIFIASFFLCFAYLQILSSFNMRRYLFIVGAVIIGRIFYFLLLYAYIWGEVDFPNTFWWTGVIDLSWSMLYLVITLKSDDIRLKDLFLPKWEGI
jgi:hypothetical protein